jgi:hypothetical protein
VEPGAWVNEDTGQVEYSDTDPSDKDDDQDRNDCDIGTKLALRRKTVTSKAVPCTEVVGTSRQLTKRSRFWTISTMVI